ATPACSFEQTIVSVAYGNDGLRSCRAQVRRAPIDRGITHAQLVTQARKSFGCTCLRGLESGAEIGVPSGDVGRLLGLRPRGVRQSLRRDFHLRIDSDVAEVAIGP